MALADHWNRVYTTKTDEQVSWFEQLPALSLRMLQAAGIDADTCVIDVGGGDSRLVDHLVEKGLSCVAVLDVSGAALERAKRRIGSRADAVTWIESDVTGEWNLKPMDIWHDRAVFHFLNESATRKRYREHLLKVLKRGGTAIIATFAPDGPEKCSGLPVSRFTPETLADELGPAVRLLESRAHTHTTPWGTTQSFQYSRFLRI